MKQIACYTGKDSLGYPVEVAQAESGLWYSRCYRFNGWAKAWSRWKQAASPMPTNRIRTPFYEDQWGWPEYKDVPVGEYVQWGFAYLQRAAPNPRARMPEPSLETGWKGILGGLCRKRQPV